MAQDATGNAVTYEAARAYDGDAGTAWRCPESPGSGRRFGLELVFSSPTSVRSVGAIPGYSKIDARYSTLDRFVQNNRVTSAKWTCTTAAGETFSIKQAFQVTSRSLQRQVVKWEKCTRITFEVLDVVAGITQDVPGVGPQVPRDATPISELEVQGWLL